MQFVIQFPNLQPNLILPEELPSDLPGGMNFRSVKLQDAHCGLAQQILDRCAGSLGTFFRARQTSSPPIPQERIPQIHHGQNCIAKVESSLFPVNLVNDTLPSLSQFELELSGLPGIERASIRCLSLPSTGVRTSKWSSGRGSYAIVMNPKLKQRRDSP